MLVRFFSGTLVCTGNVSSKPQKLMNNLEGMGQTDHQLTGTILTGILDPNWFSTQRQIS